MIWLVLGLVLFIEAHVFKRLAPDMRQGMGDKGKAVAAIISLVGVVLMVVGYRAADVVPVYAPMAGMGHANNALMVIAIYLYGVGGTKGVLYPIMRHPMLWATVIWSVAHLLVNGDRASLVLFGGIGIWALLSIVLINRAGGWVRPTNGRGLKGDLMNLAGTAVLVGVIAYIHQWLGHPVFLGNYS